MPPMQEKKNYRHFISLNGPYSYNIHVWANLYNKVGLVLLEMLIIGLGT